MKEEKRKPAQSELYKKAISEFHEVSFSPEAESDAIRLAAFDIMRKLCNEGMITEDQLRYLAEKNKINIEIR